MRGLLALACLFGGVLAWEYTRPATNAQVAPPTFFGSLGAGFQGDCLYLWDKIQKGYKWLGDCYADLSKDMGE